MTLSSDQIESLRPGFEAKTPTMIYSCVYPAQPGQTTCEVTFQPRQHLPEGFPTLMFCVFFVVVIGVIALTAALNPGGE